MVVKKHNIYAVIIPAITMHWTFKTMTVVEGMVEVPPYKHVNSNDYSTIEEAEKEALKELIKMVKNEKNNNNIADINTSNNN